MFGGSKYLCQKLSYRLKHSNTIFVSTNEPASTACLLKLVRHWIHSQSNQVVLTGSKVDSYKKLHGGVCIQHLLKFWNPETLLAAGSFSPSILVKSFIDPLCIIDVSRMCLVAIHSVPAFYMMATSFGLTCSVCSLPAFYSCPCRITRYCSRHCQKNHWSKHRVYCTATKSRWRITLLSSLCLRSATSSKPWAFHSSDCRSLCASCS